jgi:hypothetical protein
MYPSYLGARAENSRCCSRWLAVPSCFAPMTDWNSFTAFAVRSSKVPEALPA